MKNLLLALLFIFGFESFAQVRDFDGNMYDTIQIGNQVWLKQNIRSRYYSDGSAVTQPYYAYNNDKSLVPLNGYLYSASAVKRDSNSDIMQGICPIGYRLPNDNDFLYALYNSGGHYDNGYLGANLLKDSINWNGTNTSGFSVLPGGYYIYSKFLGIGNESRIWAPAGVHSSIYMVLKDYDYLYFDRKISSLTDDCFSCRCLKNTTSGINNKNNHSYFIIYPNPAYDKIRFYTNIDINNSSVIIYNYLGKLILKSPFESELNVSNFQSGLYFILLITSDNKVYRESFFKE